MNITSPLLFLDNINEFSYILNTDTGELWSAKILCKIDVNNVIEFAWEFDSKNDEFAEFLRSIYESLELSDEYSDQMAVLTNLQSLSGAIDLLTFVDIDDCIYQIGLFESNKSSIEQLEDECVLFRCNNIWMLGSKLAGHCLTMH